MAELNTITDPNLPEPKNISTAAANKVYVSNGSGSGSWLQPYTIGFEDYNDTGTAQSLTSGSWVKITNDAAGANTLTTYKLPGKTNIWDTTSNYFDWSTAGYALGDVMQIRFDVSVTTAGTNTNIGLRLKMASTGTPYYLTVLSEIVKAAGTQQFVVIANVYMGNTNTLSNPAEIEMYTDATSTTVSVAGWSIYTTPRNPVFA